MVFRICFNLSQTLPTSKRKEWKWLTYICWWIRPKKQPTFSKLLIWSFKIKLTSFLSFNYPTIQLCKTNSNDHWLSDLGSPLIKVLWCLSLNYQLTNLEVSNSSHQQNVACAQNLSNMSKVSLPKSVKHSVLFFIRSVLRDSCCNCKRFFIKLFFAHIFLSPRLCSNWKLHFFSLSSFHSILSFRMESLLRLS